MRTVQLIAVLGAAFGLQPSEARALTLAELGVYVDLLREWNRAVR